MSRRAAFAVMTGDPWHREPMCTCIDEATANRIRDAYNGPGPSDPAEVEVIEIFEDYYPARIAIFQARVELLDGGEVGTVETKDISPWDFDPDIEMLGPIPSFRYMRTQYKLGVLQVIGSTIEGVGEVVAERIAAFKSGEWDPVADIGEGVP